MKEEEDDDDEEQRLRQRGTSGLFKTLPDRRGMNHSDGHRRRGEPSGSGMYPRLPARL